MATANNQARTKDGVCPNQINKICEGTKTPATCNLQPATSRAELIATSYYARADIQNAMFSFCKNRETVANHNNQFFAKRPDTFDYPSDILMQARQGATSFHTSEEIWADPLKINTDMTPQQYNQIKTGWDLLIDIDSPFLDYGKIAARLLIEQFEAHGIHNIGIKFSGGKGFHIILPFKAFPKEFQGLQTKDQFPDWPRDRKSTRLNSSHIPLSRMPSSA